MYIGVTVHVIMSLRFSDCRLIEGRSESNSIDVHLFIGRFVIVFNSDAIFVDVTIIARMTETAYIGRELRWVSW